MGILFLDWKLVYFDNFLYMFLKEATWYIIYILDNVSLLIGHAILGNLELVYRPFFLNFGV